MLRWTNLFTGGDVEEPSVNVRYTESRFHNGSRQYYCTESEKWVYWYEVDGDIFNGECVTKKEDDDAEV